MRVQWASSGAVSVVSGHIRGETNTLPLHVEILYNEYNAVGAFASASVLALLALLTLVGQERSLNGACAGKPACWRGTCRRRKSWQR
jgi:ABC-type sulfate transport system permease subunit